MMKNTVQQRTSAQGKKPSRLQQQSMIFNDKYILSTLLGKGSFGSVFRAILNTVNKDGEKTSKNLPQYVAVKVQHDISKSQIVNEVVVLEEINKRNKSKTGFPKVIGQGVQQGCHYMILDLLGPNLNDLMILCGGKFSLGTAINLVTQIIQRIKMLHESGFIYRDIKPENFVMGLDKNSHQVFIIDFGLCRRSKDKNTKLKSPYKQNVTIVGTIRYASLSSHLGIEQSERDDIQSIFYMLIYFLKGKLPWQGLDIANKVQKDYKIMQIKLKMSASTLCQGLPVQLQNIFQYIKSLDFYKEIDYDYLISQLSCLLENKKQHKFDWQLFNQQKTFDKQTLQIVIHKPLDQNKNLNGKLTKMDEIMSESSCGQSKQNSIQNHNQAPIKYNNEGNRNKGYRSSGFKSLNGEFEAKL